MVMRLGKPGRAILETLTPDDCWMVHMAGCLPGEASELYDAIIDNRTQSKDVLEELGDFAFYLVAVRAAFGKRPEHVQWCGLTAGCGVDTKAQDFCIELMRTSGHLWDVVKRIVIYRKPMDVPDSKYGGSTLRSVAIAMLDDLERWFNMLLLSNGCTLEQVLEANYTKLADVDKGRYSKGTYSDEQAQARQDKA